MKTKTRFHKLTAWLLTLAMLMTFILSFTMGVSAAETISGTLTTDITWAYNSETKTLTLTGEGRTPYYASASSKKPWNDYMPYIENVEIGYGITYLGNYLFSDLNALKNVTIPDSVTIITGAFRNCVELEEIKIPYSVTDILSNSFEGCTKLTKVHLEEGLKTIEMHAFKNCNIKIIEIPNSVTKINTYAFQGCTQIDKIVIGKGIETIGRYAFSGSTPSEVYINCTNAEYEEKGIGTLFLPSSTKVYYSDTPNIVRFDSNGGYCDTPFATVNSENMIDNFPTPTKDNVTFDGWYDSTVGGNKISSDTIFNVPTTVYARWNESIKVIFETNGGSCSVNYAYTNENGKLSALPTATKENCIFIGWYDSRDNEVTTESMILETTAIYAKYEAIDNHEIELIFPCEKESVEEILLTNYLPPDVAITSVSITDAATVSKTSPAWTSNSNYAEITITTINSSKATSDTLLVKVITSNYGTITFNIKVSLIDFEIYSYDNTTNSAGIMFNKTGTYTVIFADYDDDRFANVETQEITITETGTVPVSITKGFTLGTDDKIMLWNNMTDLVPLCEAYIVK